MHRSSALDQLQQLAAQLREHHTSSDVAAALHQAAHIYLLAPSSFLGQSFAVPLAQHFIAEGKQVTLVDDTLGTRLPALPSCAVLGTQAFTQERPLAGLAINMANTTFAHGFFSTAAARACVPALDIVPVLDALDFPVIYQTASAMRQATLARLDDYLALARKLDDALSIQTLAAFLAMRVRLDRNAVLPILCSLEDEYFSPYPAGKDVSFALGSNEILCDIGAHVGSTVRKFLTATQWRYTGIYAFEPDAGNFAALKQGVFKDLAHFQPRNIALSDTHSMLGFSETGTMGSRLDVAGNVQVQASTLDDEVPHATFIKMDVEGHEVKILQGARQLIANSKPRMAITGYHYADDLLDIAQLVHEIEPAYRLRLRHHSFYYYDTILYADIQP